jgi:hypothetical protein
VREGRAREGGGALADPAVGPPEDADGDGDAQLGGPQEFHRHQRLAAVDSNIAAPLPTAPAYRTRIPSSARITYQLTRGLFSGTGTLDWRVAADGYELRLDGGMPLIGTLITQTSRGRFDAAGLAPERYTEKRPGRSERAANFQRPQGQVSFSGGEQTQALVPGLQDRLSVMLQWRYDMANVLFVPPESFDPPPRVDSAVVRMVPLATPPVVNVKTLETLVQVAFSQRRKILRNTLGKWLDEKGFAGQFDLQRRAEEVPVAEFVALAQAV